MNINEAKEVIIKQNEIFLKQEEIIKKQFDIAVKIQKEALQSSIDKLIKSTKIMKNKGEKDIIAEANAITKRNANANGMANANGKGKVIVFNPSDPLDGFREITGINAFNKRMDETYNKRMDEIFNKK